MSKRSFLAGVLVSVSIAVSACVTMPTSGDPHAFDLASPDTEPVEQLGYGPQRNSPPERIISDFLRASAAGSTDDFVTAKKYLSDELAASWKPRVSVLVYPTDKAPSVRLEKEDTRDVEAVVEAQIIATVNDDGELSVQDGTKLEFTFDLFQGADGQWRITGMEDGIILSEASFESSYQAMQLYFLAPGQASLVPDPHWYPRRRMASYLVGGLLKGPSEQLQSAVSSALGESLRLPTQGVEIDGQVARVVMEGEPPAGQIAPENISRQLTATLQQMKMVTSVETEINAVSLPVVSEPFGAPQDLDAMVGLREGAIVISAGNAWETVLGAEAVGLEPAAPTRTPNDPRVFAWLTGADQVSVWSGGAARVVDVPGAIEPSADRWGWVWTGENGGDQLSAINSTGGDVNLALPAGMSGGLEKVAVSPDGVRALLLVRGEEGVLPYTAAIVRDGAGAPQRLTGVKPVEMIPGSVLDGSWAGYSSLVFLSGEGEDRTVTVAPLGGFPQTLGAPAEAQRISAGSQANRILLETDEAGYYSRSGGVWRVMDYDVEDTSYAG